MRVPSKIKHAQKKGLFRCFTNTAKGKEPPPSGLVDALVYFGIDSPIAKLEKQRLQERCSRGGPWEPGEREEILAYCKTDVTPLPRLLEKLLPHINLAQALERGRFTKTVAAMEGTGLPIDVPKYDEVIRKRKLVIAKLIEPIDKVFQIYSGTTFKLDRFTAYLEREAITDWPRTPRGRPVLKVKALGHVLAKYPQVAPLFQLTCQIGKLRKCSLKIGHDGFARTSLLPFVAATGRSQPKAREFHYAMPAWMRFLIVAPPGYAVASLDWSGQEIAIAAIKSGDKNLREVYESGDAHLKAGKLFKLIPEEGTAETHAAEREMIKPFLFGTNYGAGEKTLAALAKITLQKARELRIAHRRTFPDFWRIEGFQLRAYREGRIETGFGWQMKVPPETRATTLMDCDAVDRQRDDAARSVRGDGGRDHALLHGA
jgi:hypothetical protein